jgi:uncharacterized membrane protein YagU involved in acid resistance
VQIARRRGEHDAVLDLDVLIPRHVAGGLIGRQALAGGASVELLGPILQWSMSVIIAAIYVLASGRLLFMHRLWVASGLAYGVAIFVVMNYVVVPLSAWGVWPRFTVVKFAANLAAMLLFGLIVAFFDRRRIRS